MSKKYSRESLVACVGGGLSAIALGAQLQRWYRLADIAIFERNEDLGGTWMSNSYPGCACDVPSALYSFSFEKNPEWSRMYPSAQEMKSYAQRVADKYSLQPKMRFTSEVERCDWNEEANRWSLRILDKKSGQRHEHTCKVLFSCVGFLTAPKRWECEGFEKFAGPVMHSSRWNDKIEFSSKHVVVIGNGCTAAQLVPDLLRKAFPKKITQVARERQWMFPPLDIRYTPARRWIIKSIPGAMVVHRLYIFLLIEMLLMLFYMNWLGRLMRKVSKPAIVKYVKETSPNGFHRQLIPDYEIGCRRGVIDRGYLQSLHDPRVRLESRRPRFVLPHGLQFEDGFEAKADIIILAHGFETNRFLNNMRVTGKDGRTLDEHWHKFAGPTAYNCTAMSGFPNFFMILGPNSVSGHTSALMAAEK